MKSASLSILFTILFSFMVGASSYNFLDSDDSNVKLIYLDFWASWCSPCASSFPWMESMHHKYKGKGLKIIAVNIDEDIKARDAFLAKYSPSFEIKLDDRQQKYSTHYSVDNLPKSFLLDSSGSILATHNGFTKSKAKIIESEINALLKQ